MLNSIKLFSCVYTRCQSLSAAPGAVACQAPLSMGGILQAKKVLEWAAIPVSGGSSRPGIKPGPPALQADSLSSGPAGKPVYTVHTHARLYTCAYMRASVYMCVHTGACIHVRTHACACIHVRTCVRLYTSAYTRAPVYMRVHTHLHTYVYTRTCLYTCAYTHARLYTCAYTRASVYMCTHTFAYICVHGHVPVYMCVHACVCIHVCAHTFTPHLGVFFRGFLIQFFNLPCCETDPLSSEF